MAFIRTKKIGKNTYAYVVENKWRKKGGSRQKVGKYLGRVITLEILNNNNLKIKFDSKKNVVKNLIKWELSKLGFKRSNENMIFGDLIFNLERNQFEDKKGAVKKIVLEINEGFLCYYTLSKLIRFKTKTDDARDAGIELAKTFLEAGLKVPKEIFIEYYSKI